MVYASEWLFTRLTKWTGVAHAISPTLASHILCFARSMETVLRHPGYGRFPTPLDWAGVAHAISPTLASHILCFARSMETVLRHPGYGRFPTPLDWTGVAHAISPDARFAHPVLRSLDGNRPSPSWLRTVSNAARLAWATPQLKLGT